MTSSNNNNNDPSEKTGTKTFLQNLKKIKDEMQERKKKRDSKELFERYQQDQKVAPELRVAPTPAPSSAPLTPEKIDTILPTQEVVEEEEVIDLEKTQSLTSIDHLPVISEGMMELENSEKVLQRNRKKNTFDNINSGAAVSSIKVKQKSKSKLLIVISILLIGYLLLDEDTSNKKLESYELLFPQVKEVENITESKKQLEKGLEYFKQHNFENYLRSVPHFLLSTEHQFNDNKALSLLSRVYSELWIYSKNPQQGKLNTYNLIRLLPANVGDDLDAIFAKGRFFLSIKRPKTAVRILEDHLRLNNKKIDTSFLALYLEGLMETGDFVKASDVASRIRPDQLTESGLLVFGNYLFFEQKLDDLEKHLAIGLEKFPQSVYLNYLKFKLELPRDNKDNLVIILKTLGPLFTNKEKILSPRERALYSEMKGDYFVKINKFDEAAKAYQSSLKEYPLEGLQQRLSALNFTGENHQNIQAHLISLSQSAVFYKKANDYLYQSDLKNALLFAVKALDATPDSESAIALVAKIQMLLGDFASAKMLLAAEFNKNPSSFKLFSSYITLLIELNNLKDAEIIMMKFRTKELEIPAQFYAIEGKFFEAQRRFDRAIASYREANRKDALDDEVQYQLSQVYYQTKRFKNARETISQALQLDPYNVDYIYLYAKIIYETDGLEAAQGILREASSIHKDNLKIQSGLAIFYYRSGKIKEYLELDKVLQSNINTPPLYFEFLLEQAILDGVQERVIDISEKLLNRDPGNFDAQMLLGSFLRVQGNITKAKDVFNDLFVKMPSYPKLNYQLARLYLAQDLIEEAKKSAEKEIEFHPDQEWGHIARAETFYAEKDWARAKQSLDQALKRNPDSIEALSMMGEIRFFQNELNEARDLFRRVKGKDPANANAYYYLGKILFKQAQKELAFDEFKTYLELNPRASNRIEVESIMRDIKKGL